MIIFSMLVNFTIAATNHTVRETSVCWGLSTNLVQMAKSEGFYKFGLSENLLGFVIE